MTEAFEFQKLLSHVGHKLSCVVYGEQENVAVECEDCGTVLIDHDNPSKF